VKVIHDGKQALRYLSDLSLSNEDVAAVFLDMNLPHV